MQTALTIAQRRLPIEMTIPPSFRKVNPADFPVLFVVARLRRRCRCRRSTNMATSPSGRRCRKFPAWPRSLIYGAQKFAIRVQADPEAAAARGLSLEDIRTAVSRANSSTPVGTLNGPKQDVALQASGQMDKAADYSKVVVAWRNGSPVKLDEVAQDLRQRRKRQDRDLAERRTRDRARRSRSSRTPTRSRWSIGVLAKLPALRAQIPPSVTMQRDDGPLDFDPSGGEPTSRKRC